MVGQDKGDGMDKEMKALLQAAAVTGRLPIVRFELRSSKDRELISTALRDVWMTGASRRGRRGSPRRRRRDWCR